MGKCRAVIYLKKKAQEMHSQPFLRAVMGSNNMRSSDLKFQ